jgi:hypothetical protein
VIVRDPIYQEPRDQTCQKKSKRIEVSLVDTYVVVRGTPWR